MTIVNIVMLTFVLIDNGTVKLKGLEGNRNNNQHKQLITIAASPIILSLESRVSSPFYHR